MTPKEWSAIEALFHEALEKPESERAAFLDRACRDDTSMRRNVESLIVRAVKNDASFERDVLQVASDVSNKTEQTILGQTIGHYEVRSLLGSGGMGEVYRARDTRLKRDVAIKILPEGFSSDPKRVSRFRREAEALAALNHQNIATIYDLQESGRTHFLVLELVEGDTLARTLEKRGALPVNEAIHIAKQICNALEAAHERGIVHRDLKPGNVMITANGSVKVLDFGLAKVFFDEDSTNPPNVPTAVSGTEANAILGTAPYMSPEQARGKAVDKRTDIWAFGCVLYEALTGFRTFAGDTTLDTVAKILEHEPDWNRLPEGTPAALRVLLRRCLEKDSARRLRDIGDARIELEDSLATGSTAERSVSRVSATPRRRGGWVVAGLAIIIAIAAVVGFRFNAQRNIAPIQFLVGPPDGATFVAFSRPGSATIPWPAISPDGRRLAFVATNAEGKQFVWIRPLDSVKALPLPGSELGETPFWSPDSRFLGFFANGKLKKIDVSGGLPQTLGNTVGYVGGTWSSEGVIVFGSQETGRSLNRIPASGGTPTPLTTLDVSAGETFHAWPHFLPDGRHYLFFAGNSKPEAGAIYLGSIDSTERTLLVKATSEAIYSPPGYLLYVLSGTLMAHHFDAKQLTLSGDPFPIAENVAQNVSTGVIACSASNDGVLVYRTGGATAATQLVWLDRVGKRLGALDPPGADANPRLSPDGKRLVVGRETSGTIGNRHIWMVDLARGFPFRFTLDDAAQNFPIWAPDGSRIAFASNRGGSVNFYQKLSSGAATDDVLFKSGGGVLEDWSPDGQFIVYRLPGKGTPRTDLWVLPVGSKKAVPFAETPHDERQARISPNGRWMAYVSNELGRDEVYVQTFPQPSAKIMISTNGGLQPTWSGDSKELFYIAPDKNLMTVAIRGGAGLEADKPTLLFQAPFLRLSNSYYYEYDVAADGKRFLFIAPALGVGAPPMTVVVNWTASLRR